MSLFVYDHRDCSLVEFVSFWSKQYQDPRERLYEENIGRPFTPTSIHALYEWKNGDPLSDKKRASVERNYVNRRHELGALPTDLDASGFLSAFPVGGAIWRIFWLHCWKPNRFPIFDQHVHRAMAVLQDRARLELPAADSAKIGIYAREYMPFHAGLMKEHLDPRNLDRALWAVGKFVRVYEIPGRWSGSCTHE